MVQDKYQTEQEQLLGQIQSLENALQEVKDSQTNAVQWAALMAEYVGIHELTAENLNIINSSTQSVYLPSAISLFEWVQKIQKF